MAPTTDTSPIFVHSMSPFAGAQIVTGAGGSGGVLTSNAYPSAGLSILYPFELPFAYTIARFFWVNGGAVAGNTDVGVYSSALSLLTHTGSIANAGTSVPQYTAVAFSLTAGQYFLAISCSSVGQGFYSLNAPPVGAFAQMGGVLGQASGPPLPGSAAPTAQQIPYRPLFGFTRTASGY